MAVEVKICGLSTPESLDAALDAGADFVGLVFFPKSPRNVTLEQAATELKGKAAPVLEARRKLAETVQCEAETKP